MRVQYASDLHLEFFSDPGHWNPVMPALGCEVLVLAGDIVMLRDLRPLRTCVEPFYDAGIPVLFVPGNHEYYGCRAPMTTALRAEVEDIPGLQLLDNDVAVLGQTRFVGSTLWSPLKEVEAGVGVPTDHELRQQMSDFRRIRYGDGSQALTPARMRTLHRQSLRWLQNTLRSPHVGPTVVITHFVPTPQGIAPQYVGDEYNAYFIADCRACMDQEIALWITGHVHETIHCSEGSRSIPIVSNPRGYLKTDGWENQHFQPKAVYDVA